MNNTKIIGILNITPDSFSDGGEFFLKPTAINHTIKLIEEGASVIDIGAESTKPGASLINLSEEKNRLQTLYEILKIAHEKNVEVSIDTTKSEIAKWAIDLGVDYINDVSGMQNDPNMIKVVSDSQVKIILTHNLGVPTNKNLTISEEKNVIDEILPWFKRRISDCQKLKIKNDRIIIDPGIGFGKTSGQSWDIIRNIDKIKKLGFKICVAHSRKSLLSNLERYIKLSKDELTLGVSMFLFQHDIDYIRVHNVGMHTSAFTSYNECKKH